MGSRGLGTHDFISQRKRVIFLPAENSIKQYKVLAANQPMPALEDFKDSTGPKGAGVREELVRMAPLFGGPLKPVIAVEEVRIRGCHR